MFSCSSVEELEAKLEAVEGDDKPTFTRPTAPSVILCFGGQVSTSVSLDRRVYEGSTLLRKHLGEVDKTIQLLGYGSIFPSVFQTAPVADIVELQLCLFALQYSSAKAWLDCGLKVASLVGHSFGELTAMCVSGMLDLRDAVTMIHGRAKQIRDGWGSDRGAMMAVEGDQEEVLGLLARSEARLPQEPAASIACFNGPRHFTLAGTTKSIDNVASTVEDDPVAAGAIKGRKLNVTNAFHSVLTEPLLDGLKSLASGLTLRVPTIDLERATEVPSSGPLTQDFLGAHLRNPVYFDHAVQRLAKTHPSSIWLEAGSASTITSMANKAISSSNPGGIFQSVDITSSKGGLSSLADATVNLWKAGLTIAYWPHHGSQTADYASILLPPYQFEANKHWLELKMPVKESTKTVTQVREDPPTLWDFVELGDGRNQSATFRINPSSREFRDALNGCKIGGITPTLSVTKQIEIATAALASIRPAPGELHEALQIQSVVVHEPVDPKSSVILLEAEAQDPSSCLWSWRIASGAKVFTTGAMVIRSGIDVQARAEFAKYSRLFKHQRCLDILNNQDSDEVMQGRNIYTTYANIVEYGSRFKSLQKIVGRGDECAAIVKGVQPSHPGQFSSVFAEALSQVAGIFANCMSAQPGQDMLILGGIEQWITSPIRMNQDHDSTGLWHVYASNYWTTGTDMLSDVFVFDAKTGALANVILGISYCKVTEGRAGDRRTESRLLLEQTNLTPHPVPQTLQPTIGSGSEALKTQAAAAPAGSSTSDPSPAISAASITKRIIGILTAISGLESSEINTDTGLADIGIDSLMGMELARESTMNLNAPWTQMT